MGLLSRPNSFRKDAPAAEEVTAALHMSSLCFTFILILDYFCFLPRHAADRSRAHPGSGSFALGAGYLCSRQTMVLAGVWQAVMHLSQLLGHLRGAWPALHESPEQPCGVQAPLLREFQDESRSRRGTHAPTQHDTCCKHAALGYTQPSPWVVLEEALREALGMTWPAVMFCVRMQSPCRGRGAGASLCGQSLQ